MFLEGNHRKGSLLKSSAIFFRKKPREECEGNHGKRSSLKSNAVFGRKPLEGCNVFGRKPREGELTKIKCCAGVDGYMRAGKHGRGDKKKFHFGQNHFP